MSAKVGWRHGKSAASQGFHNRVATKPAALLLHKLPAIQEPKILTHLHSIVPPATVPVP